MEMQPLISVGLTKLQAETYALLIEHGQLSPPQVASRLKLTRSNAYKLLDKLVELGLVKKADVDKKLSYAPNNPMSLVDMVAAERNTVSAKETAVRQVVNNLLAQYNQHTESPSVSVVSGVQDVADAYRAQIQLDSDIHFIRSRADIPTLGFNTMHEIRTTPERHGHQRYCIQPDISKGKVNKTKLARTWIKQEDYTAPVEWSVSGPSLLIVIFGDEPHAITIINPLVAEAFRQLWALIDTTVRAMPYYKSLPRINS